MDIFSGYVYNLRMMPVMVRETDLDRIDVPENYEVLDATALGRRLGFKRHTVLAYLSRRNFRRIPRPNRQLAMGPIWYEKSVREWEAQEEDQAGGKYEPQQRVQELGRKLALCPEGVHRVRPPSETRHRRDPAHWRPIPERSEAVRTLRERGLSSQDRAPSGSFVEGQGDRGDSKGRRLIRTGKALAGTRPRHLGACGDDRGPENRTGRRLPGAGEPGASGQARR